MSKPVKELIMRDYRDRLGDTEDVTVITLRGVDANRNNAIRAGLASKDIHVTVVRNNLFMRTFKGTSLEKLEPVLTGSNAVVYGAESVVEVAREIVELAKQHEEIELKGAILDGILFEGDAGVKALSKYPTRDEAIAQDVALLLGPGRKLVGALKGPGGRLMGIVKAVEEKLEKGEEIAKV